MKKLYFEWWLGMVMLVLSLQYYFTEQSTEALIRFYGTNLFAIVCFMANAVKQHIDSKL